jgi:hypothetical protein
MSAVCVGVARQRDRVLNPSRVSVRLRNDGVGGFDFGRDLARGMNQPQIIIVIEGMR